PLLGAHPPVDAAQVVAVAVLAYEDVVLAGLADALGGRVAGGPGAHGVLDAGEPPHLRGHAEGGVVARDGPVVAGQSQGVVRARAQGTQPEVTAVVGLEVVADRLAPRAEP